MGTIVHRRLHILSFHQLIQLLDQLLLHLRVDAQQSLFSGPQLLFLKFELDVTDGLVLLKLLLQLLDFLVGRLRLFLVVRVLALQLCFQLLHGLRRLPLLLLHLTQSFLLPPLGLHLGDEVLEGHFYEVSLGLLQPLLHLGSLCLHLLEIPLDVGVLLQVPAQALVALLQSVSNVLDLALGLHKICLVAEALQLTASGDELLVPTLQVALLLDYSRDLIAHELCQLISMNRGTGGDAREEVELPQCFLQ
mmetsp:Transcript_37418/g.60292  ORF Transcript_37418/g.60292 Transcript_37418/m.60292 type:complete len:249 (-) Transcript_37418:164-910(-)